MKVQKLLLTIGATVTLGAAFADTTTAATTTDASAVAATSKPAVKVIATAKAGNVVDKSGKVIQAGQQN